MALYESTFIVRQDISAQEVDKIADIFSKVVNDNKGKVVKKEYWGLLNLAYKVNKNKKGHYIFLGVDAPSAAIDELTRQYKLNEDVIRNLTIKVDEISKEASPLFAKKVAPRKTSYNKEDK
jgi:small subunit ribosomal protein S6